MNQICKQTHEYFKQFSYLDNSDWIIKLNNPELANIDPKNESQLSDDQKAAIITECKENPIYFFREILEYPEFGGREFEPFKLTKNTSAKIFLELYCNKGVLDLDPRQSLKTGTALMIILYKFLFSTKEDIKIITKDLNQGLRDLDIIEKTIHHLPKYLLPDNGIAFRKKSFLNNYNRSEISLFPILLKQFKEGTDQAIIAQHFDIVFVGFIATHILIDDMIYKWFDLLYRALYAKVYDKKCIIDVIQYLYDKSGFVKDYWYFGTAWDEAFYDKIPNYTSMLDLILLHYEPEELYDLQSIYHLSKCLLVEEDSDDKIFNQFRNELCIRPYDNDFNIRDYYKKLKEKCESK